MSNGRKITLEEILQTEVWDEKDIMTKDWLTDDDSIYEEVGARRTLGTTQ